MFTWAPYTCVVVVDDDDYYVVDDDDDDVHVGSVHLNNYVFVDDDVVG